MPIRPENRKRYPSNWRDVRDRIMDRARCEDGSHESNIYSYRCECEGECGKHVHRCGRWHHQSLSHVEDRWVVLTIAHLDHKPENCDPANLRAMCQRCHNAYDAPVRAQNRRTRLLREAEEAGQTAFPEGDFRVGVEGPAESGSMYDYENRMLGEPE